MAAPPIPFRPADPAPLWDGFKARYRHVYHTGKGDRYAAQVRVGRVKYHVGKAGTRREAAALAAGFLLAHYGPAWPARHRAAASAAARAAALCRWAGAAAGRRAAKSPPGAG